MIQSTLVSELRSSHLRSKIAARNVALDEMCINERSAVRLGVQNDIRRQQCRTRRREGPLFSGQQSRPRNFKTFIGFSPNLGNTCQQYSDRPKNGLGTEPSRTPVDATPSRFRVGEGKHITALATYNCQSVGAWLDRATASVRRAFLPDYGKGPRSKTSADLYQ